MLLREITVEDRPFWYATSCRPVDKDQNMYLRNWLRLAGNYEVAGLYEINFFARLYGVTN